LLDRTCGVRGIVENLISSRQSEDEAAKPVDRLSLLSLPRKNNENENFSYFM